MTDPLVAIDHRLSAYAARWQDGLPEPSGLESLHAITGRGTWRRRTSLAAAAAVLVAVGAPFAYLSLGSSEGSGPDPVAPTPALTDDALGCSAPAPTPVDGSPVVPVGAIAARLCGGLVDNGGFDLRWRADVLTPERTGALVGKLNTLTPYVQPETCNQPGSAPYSLVLLYPDGSRVRLDGTTAGNCANLQVEGGPAWAGSASILELTQRLISEQRVATPPSAPPTPAACPESWNDVASTDRAAPVRGEKRVVITACRYQLDLSDTTTITQSAPGVLGDSAVVPDPARLLTLIRDGSKADPCQGGDYALHDTQDVLLVSDRYGDLQTVSTTPCWANTLTGVTRYPSNELAGAVDDLLEPISRPAATGCKHQGQVADSTYTITFEIFSGRPSPTWDLTAAEAADLRAMLRKDRTGAAPMDQYPDRSGYLWYLVEAKDSERPFLGSVGLPTQFQVFVDIDATGRHIGPKPLPALLSRFFDCRLQDGVFRDAFGQPVG